MLFWRLGASLWLFRWIFRDPKVDVRYLAAGVVVPDVVDMTVGTLLFPAAFSRSELWAHSLAAASAYMAVVLVVTRRGRKRRALMAVGVAWLFHLLLDFMWAKPEILFWPFFGWELPPGAAPFWPMAWSRAWDDPWRWALEAVGLAYLSWLYFAAGLHDSDRRKELARTGRIPRTPDPDA